MSGSDPFAAGWMRLIDAGSGTAVDVDLTGSPDGAQWQTLAMLQGVSASSVSAQNFVQTVNASNRAPTGTPTTVLPDGTEDTTYTIAAADLLGGFTDADGDALSVANLAANHGSLADNGNGTWTFIPDANYFGTVALSYDVVDGNGGSVPAVQGFTLAAVNDAPTGTPAAVLTTGTEDTPYPIAAADLLAGFTDVDGDVLSVANLSADHGTLVNNNNGTWTFTPDPNYNGAVALSYDVIDGQGGSVAAVQGFSLAAVNDAPTGTPTALLPSGTEDTPYLIAAADLLAGFSDVDGDALSVADLTADHGSLADNLDGSWTLTPEANYFGPVALTYDVVDGNGGSVAAAQGFSLAAVNNAPTGTPTAVLAGGTEDTPYVIVAADLLAGFSDVDGDALSVANLAADHGSLTDSLDGTWAFAPEANYFGPVALTYVVIDGQGGSVAATQGFNLAAVNDAPQGTPTAVLTAGTEDTPYLIAASDLLAGFSDVDGDTLRVANLSADHGSLNDNLDGTWTFTPDADYFGPVVLTYDVIDGQGGSIAATQGFSLTALNSAPTGSPTAVLAVGTEDTPYLIAAVDLLAGFSDPDGDTLSVANLSASHGALVNNGDGTWTFTPEANYHGAVALTYDVVDGQGGSVPAVQGFSLEAVNDAPTVAIAPGAQTANEDAPFSFTLAAGAFADVDTGDVLTLGTQRADGTALPAWLGFNAVTRTFSGTPANGDVVTVDIRVTATDLAGAATSLTFALTVLNTNDAPVALPDTVTTDRNTPVLIDVLVNDSDVDVGDALGVSAFTQPSNGSVTLDGATGQLLYTPKSNWSGTESFTYTASDGNGGAATAEVSVTVATAIVGDDTANTLTGTNGADIIDGRGGDDIISARSGDDIVLGGAGNDQITGGSGADMLDGGAGDDRFFASGSELTGDTITRSSAATALTRWCSQAM